MTTGLSAIDFPPDLEKLTKDFTGRQWVFDDIDRPQDLNNYKHLKVRSND
jgi:hypothetical protein